MGIFVCNKKNGRSFKDEEIILVSSSFYCTVKGLVISPNIFMLIYFVLFFI